jgi:hypothetical protein
VYIKGSVTLRRWIESRHIPSPFLPISLTHSLAPQSLANCALGQRSRPQVRLRLQMLVAVIAKVTVLLAIKFYWILIDTAYLSSTLHYLDYALIFPKYGWTGAPDALSSSSSSSVLLRPTTAAILEFFSSSRPRLCPSSAAFINQLLLSAFLSLAPNALI